MQLWLNFWNLIFWFSFFGFLINYSNFLFLFLFSEATWIILYTYCVFVGVFLEDLNMFSSTFFILGLAGIEFAVGFLLLILFKKFNISFNIIENDNSLNVFKKDTNNKNYTLTNFYWYK